MKEMLVLYTLLFTTLLCVQGSPTEKPNTQVSTTTPKSCVCTPYYQCSNQLIVPDGTTIDLRVNVTQECENILDICCPLADIQNGTSTVKPVVQKPTEKSNSTASNTEHPCVCTPYYLCPMEPLDSDSDSVLYIRLPVEYECESYLEVCCPPANILSEPVSVQPTVANKTKQAKRNTNEGCGVRHLEGVGFRISSGLLGNISEFGEFPWMVGVLEKKSIDSGTINVYQCGGTLIHPQVVVTAAHCVFGISKQKSYMVRAGEWDTQTKNEIYVHQDRDVKQIIIHEKYNNSDLINNIALLILNTSVTIEDNVNVLCLPPQNEQIDHDMCIVSGWGKTIPTGTYNPIMKKVEMPIVPRSTCQESLRKTDLGNSFELHQSFLCAGGEPDKDVCKGDDGSPLACPIKGQTNRYYHAGIVAWGLGCGQKNVPGVYTNVAKFRNWIDTQMDTLKFEKTFYTYKN